MKNHQAAFPQKFLSGCFRRIGWAISLFAFSAAIAFAHDPYEVTTKAYIRSNSLELRLTLAATTVESLLGAADEHASVSEILSDVDKYRPVLNRCAAEFFQVVASNRKMVALQTNVTVTVEDHVEFVLTYPRPPAGTLRLNAAGLGKLPDNEPYGAILTLTDLANNVVMEQKLLTASDPSVEVTVLAVPNETVAPDNSNSKASPAKAVKQHP